MRRRKWGYLVSKGLDLSPAFRELRQLGYYARQQSINSKPDSVTEKWVMLHESSVTLKSKGEDFFLDWKGNGGEICNVLRKHGIKTMWSGSDAITIKVIQ